MDGDTYDVVKWVVIVCLGVAAWLVMSPDDDDVPTWSPPDDEDDQ